MSEILCVAAGPQELDWYCGTLRRAGHAVTAASSLEDALQALRRKQHYHLLVTSWLLGGCERARPH